MASFDYAEMAALALELLTEFGDDGTLIRLGVATLAADGSAAPASTSSETVKMLEVTGRSRSGLAAAGSLADDVRAFSATHIFAPVSPEPAIGSRFTFDGRTLSIKGVKTVRPSGTTLLHFIEAGVP